MANTIWNSADKSPNITLTGSNLIATAASATNGSVRAVDRQTTGKFYWEYTCNTITNNSTSLGVASGVFPVTSILTSQPTQTVAISRLGTIFINGVTTGITLGTLANGNVVGIALDLTNRAVWYRIGAAGNWNNNATYNPATGVGGVAIDAGQGIAAYPVASVVGTSEQITANFGDTAFTGAVPSGYTSGFTAGASVPTNAIASQALAEHWLTTDPDARITQVIAEHWASVASDNLQAVVTFVALEHWTSVAVVVPAAGGPMVTMIH